jgi:CheY-like chemotaxis protein
MSALARAPAREVLPDVILCDIGFPGMDGYAVACAIRGEPGLLRSLLIAISGYGRLALDPMTP